MKFHTHILYVIINLWKNNISVVKNNTGFLQTLKTEIFEKLALFKCILSIVKDGKIYLHSLLLILTKYLKGFQWKVSV